MAKEVLSTEYKDDVLEDSMGKKRRYNVIQNDDGTISLEDATEYAQVGDNYGAAQINATNQAVNESVDKATIIDSLADVVANTQSGMPVGAKAIAELNSNLTVKKKKITGSYGIEFNLLSTGNVIELSTNTQLSKEIPINNKSVIIGTLPVGYQPANRVIVKPNMTGAIPQIIINTDGTINIANGKDYSGNDCNYPASWFRLEIMYITSG